jgi:hypothetical protein
MYNFNIICIIFLFIIYTKTYKLRTKKGYIIYLIIIYTKIYKLRTKKFL